MPLRPISPGLDSLLRELEEPPRLPDVAALHSPPVAWWDTGAETQLEVSSPLPQQHVALDVTDDALAGSTNESETEGNHRAGVAEGAASAREGDRSPERSTLQPEETKSLAKDAEPSSSDATTSPLLEPPKQVESLRPPGRKRPAPPPPPPPLATWLAGKGGPNTAPTLLTASEAVRSPAASPSAPEPPPSTPNSAKAPIPFRATSASQLEPSGPVSVEQSSPVVAKPVASSSTAAATGSAGHVKPPPTTTAPALKVEMPSKRLEIEKATTSAKLSTEVGVAPSASMWSPAASKLSSGASPSTSNALAPGEASSPAKPPTAVPSTHPIPDKAQKPSGKLQSAKAGAAAKAGTAATAPAPASSARPSLGPGQSPSATSRQKIKIATTVTTVRRPAATTTAAGNARAMTSGGGGARLASGSTAARVLPPSSAGGSPSGATFAKDSTKAVYREDSSSDSSSGEGKPRRSSLKTKQQQSETSALVEDSSWITFSLANPVQTMPRSKSRVKHTVQRRPAGEPITLAQLPIELQRKIMLKLLEANRDLLGNYHYILPAPSPQAVQKLLQLAPIDLAVLGGFANPSSDPPGLETIQPIPTAYLSYQLASGETTFVENYAYLLEGYVTTAQEAEAVLDYFEHPDTIAKADAVGLSRAVRQFSAGLRRFRDQGGWRGTRKRVFAYAGWSNGGRYRTGKQKQVDPRPYKHFVGPKASSVTFAQFLLRELQAGLAAQHVEVFCTFAGTANSLSTNSPLGQKDIMLLESLIAVARLCTVDLGAGNLAPCSGGILATDALHCLDGLPADVKLADALEMDKLPSSLRLFFERYLAYDLTVAAALPVLRRYSHQQQHNDNNRQHQGERRGRIFPVQPPLLINANSPAAKPPRPLTRAQRGLLPIPIIREINVDAVLGRESKAVQAEFSPHANEPYYSALIDLLATSRRNARNNPDWYGTIVTRQNIRQGIKLRFTSANANSRHNELGTRIIACHGEKTMILSCRVSPVASVSEAEARWDDAEEAFVVEKNGRPIMLGAMVVGGFEEWYWDLETTKQKILPASQAQERDQREERKAEAAGLLHKILSMW